MDIFAQFATDPKLELEGKWFEIGAAERTLENGEPDPESVPKILVARSGNKRHGRIVSKLYEANKSTLELKNDAADAKGEEITIETMAKAILMGWKNLSIKGEKLVDGWDYETAKRLLAIKDFRNMVNKKADSFEEFKVVQEDAAVKN
jgi:hypothetical protein